MFKKHRRGEADVTTMKTYVENGPIDFEYNKMNNGSMMLHCPSVKDTPWYRRLVNRMFHSSPICKLQEKRREPPCIVVSDWDSIDETMRRIERARILREKARKMTQMRRINNYINTSSNPPIKLHDSPALNRHHFDKLKETRI